MPGMAKIVSKMTNVFSYISYCSTKMTTQTIDVVVDSKCIIKSFPKLNKFPSADVFLGATGCVMVGIVFFTG